MIKSILNKLPKTPTMEEFMEMDIYEYSEKQKALTEAVASLSWWEFQLYHLYLDWNSIRAELDTARTFPGWGLKIYCFYSAILILTFGGRLAPIVRGRIRRFWQRFSTA